MEKFLRDFSDGATEVQIGPDPDDVMRVLVLPESDPAAPDSEESLVWELLFHPYRFLKSEVFTSWYKNAPPFDNTVLIVNWDDDQNFKFPVASFFRNRPGISLTMPRRPGVFAERTQGIAMAVNQSPTVTVASNLRQAYAHYIMGDTDAERRLILGSMIWDPFGYVDSFGEPTLVFANNNQELNDSVRDRVAGKKIRMANSRDGAIFPLSSLRLVMQLNREIEDAISTTCGRCCCPAGHVHDDANGDLVVVCYVYNCTAWPCHMSADGTLIP